MLINSMKIEDASGVMVDITDHAVGNIPDEDIFRELMDSVRASTKDEKELRILDILEASEEFSDGMRKYLLGEIQRILNGDSEDERQPIGIFRL